MSQPRHSLPYSKFRERRVTTKPPRHRQDRLLERLGATVFDLEELLHISRRDQVPEWIKGASR